MKEVFKYAKNINPGDQLYDGRPIRGVKVVLMLDDHPWHCVPADEVLLVRTAVFDAGADRLFRQLQYAEDAAQAIKVKPGSEADEALKRLKRLQTLIEQSCADAANAASA